MVIFLCTGGMLVAVPDSKPPQREKILLHFDRDDWDYLPTDFKDIKSLRRSQEIRKTQQKYKDQLQHTDSDGSAPNSSRTPRIINAEFSSHRIVAVRLAYSATATSPVSFFAANLSARSNIAPFSILKLSSSALHKDKEKLSPFLTLHWISTKSASKYAMLGHTGIWTISIIKLTLIFPSRSSHSF